MQNQLSEDNMKINLKGLKTVEIITFRTVSNLKRRIYNSENKE